MLVNGHMHAICYCTFFPFLQHCASAQSLPKKFHNNKVENGHHKKIPIHIFNRVTHKFKSEDLYIICVRPSLFIRCWRLDFAPLCVCTVLYTLHSILLYIHFINSSPKFRLVWICIEETKTLLSIIFSARSKGGYDVSPNAQIYYQVCSTYA